MCKKLVSATGSNLLAHAAQLSYEDDEGMGHTSDMHTDGYSLTQFTPETRVEMMRRLQDPETWKPFNWFGFEYPATPGSAVHGPSFGDGGALAVLDTSGALVAQVQWVPGFWFGGANRHRAWNIGLIVLPEYRRTRATRAALTLLIDYLFTHTSVHRLEATTPVEAATRDAGFESTGLRREGVMRRAQWREGSWRDVTMLAILREDWVQRHTISS